MSTIYQSLNAVMAAVQAVRKTERNNQGGYLFRGIDAVVNAVGPALREHGVIVAPKVLDYQYGTVTVGKNRTEMAHARLLVEFTFYGPEGDSLVAVAAGEAMDSGDKATAKAHSVAFRTCLLQTLALPTDEPEPDKESYQRADPLTVAKQDVIAAAEAKGLSRQEMFDDFVAWSQGTKIQAADQKSLEQYAKHLRGEL